MVTVVTELYSDIRDMEREMKGEKKLQQSLTVQILLPCNSMYIQGWLKFTEISVFASPMLGLKVCVAMLGHEKKKLNDCYDLPRTMSYVRFDCCWFG